MNTSTTNDKRALQAPQVNQNKVAEQKSIEVNQANAADRRETANWPAPNVESQAQAKVGDVRLVRAENESDADFNKRVQAEHRNYKVREDTKVEELTREEDLLNFLQRISHRLKNTNSNIYPPVSIEVADEIDYYIRKLGNGDVKGYSTETVRGRTYAVKK